ncbi:MULTISPECIES: RNA-guided endonuclease TnpB family protein [unclassified Halorubrum]|uniref:RNA-guided endonuclease InsQ/TnpB family protein n=1 Tax=unclassified Halorubrum TaxID=2642239 RepID=UPI000B99B9D6|nr:MULTISPECIES: RNA-guided endonuclease TnpB family protein [unclassified Halorubrum]OYR45550.1 transposase [Halorubrum sp. Eb13]OYR51291.1 transposase [Halorubrum sp. Ea1]
MNYNYRYRLKPTERQRETLDYHRDTCRQLYNHALYRFNQTPEHEGTVKQRVRKIRDELPDLKDWWDALTDVYSKVLQPTVMRIAKNITALGKLKEQGYTVGELRWKSPREFRSFTYNQSGFELDKKGGQTVLSLSKLADIPIEHHRSLPDEATIKEVTLKQEKTGEWFAIFGIEMDTDPPAKPPLEDVGTDEMVGVDVGILKYAHDTDGTAVESLDLSEERDRLEREQRNLSRKEYESNNWKNQRQRVAACHQKIKRKRRDFLHKLSNYYAREYELVAVEDLDVKGMLESPRNSRNTASAAWNIFTDMLETKCEREGTHFVEVEPEGTSKECAQCGVETDKPLSVREHSCPACGFKADRDANAAWNILSRGLTKLGVGHSKGTPVETALPADTAVVSTKRVVETGSPCLKEPPKAVSRQG